jgi:hypothetical protein
MTDSAEYLDFISNYAATLRIPDDIDADSPFACLAGEEVPISQLNGWDNSHDSDNINIFDEASADNCNVTVETEAGAKQFENVKIPKKYIYFRNKSML